MDKLLRYWGEFRSKNGVLWRTEIWQKPGETDKWEVSRMTFPQDTPLEIEWSSVDKVEPLQPSNATLNVVSDTDRKYIDFYILEPGSVLLKVFRGYEHSVQENATAAPNDNLYWSGTLDTELYEEPFSEKSDYEVSLTFSDLAILERLKYSGPKELLNVEKLVEDCLLATQLNSEQTVRDFTAKRIEKHISTTPSTSEQSILTHDYIIGDNFYDDKGEPCTLKDVLEGILQPYALRLVQKAGKFIFYDLNKVYCEYAESEAVKWVGTDATLGVDKIYNNVKLTFSPYETTTILNPTIEVESKQGPFPDIKGPEFDFMDEISFGYDDPSGVGDVVGFNLYCLGKGKGVERGERAKFFKTESLNNGEDSTGVLWTYLRGKLPADGKDNGNGKDYGEWMPRESDNYKTASLEMPTMGNSYGDGLSDLPVVFRTEPVYIPYTGGLDVQYLNVNLPLLFDARYNPYTDASNGNEKDKSEQMRKRCNYAFVPTELEILDKEGNPLYFYSNIRNIFPSTKSYISGSWVPVDKGGKQGHGHLWLAYYNSSANHKENSGLGGWAGNRQACYPTWKSLPAVYTKAGRSGEFIRLPMHEGYLRFTVYGGLSVWEVNDYAKWLINAQNLYRWWAYKAPTIKLYDRNMKEFDKLDVEIFSYLNKSAKEDLELDTIVGTKRLKSSGVSRSTLFTAKGLLRQSNGEMRCDSYIRAGKKDYIEDLLINTIYSQYAERHVKLSGTVDLLPDFKLYTDHSEPGRYLLLSEVQNPMEDESKISMVQVSEEVYHKVDSVQET